MVMPKRIVFDGLERSKEVSLVNSGNEPATYAVSFINYKMTENGDFVQVEEPEEGQRFAIDYVRYFPRRVTLAPGEAQTVRVQLRRSGDLQPGEYRSHMYFRSVDEQTALGEEDLATEEEGISINIKTIFGISIPVIIKEGTPTTEVTMDIKKLIKEGEYPKLSLAINRTGNMSVYGDLKVEHISPEGKTTAIGLVRGVSVYTPNSKRNLSFELRKASDVDLNRGKLRITYKTEEAQVYAESHYSLN